MNEFQEAAIKARAFIGRYVWIMSGDKPVHRRCHEMIIRNAEIRIGVELCLDWETDPRGETPEIVFVPVDNVALTKEELMNKVFEL